MNIVADVGRFLPCSGSVAGLKWELPYGLHMVSEKFNQHFQGKCVIKFDVEYSDGLTRDVHWIKFSYDWLDWERTLRDMLAYIAERPEYVMKSVWKDVSGSFDSWRDGSWVERKQRWLL